MKGKIFNNNCKLSFKIKIRKIFVEIFALLIADIENNLYIVGHDYLTLVRLLTGIITLAIIISSLLHLKRVK